MVGKHSIMKSLALFPLASTCLYLSYSETKFPGSEALKWAYQLIILIKFEVFVCFRIRSTPQLSMKDSVFHQSQGEWFGELLNGYPILTQEQRGNAL